MESNEFLNGISRDDLAFALGFSCHGYKNRTDQAEDMRAARERVRKALDSPPRPIRFADLPKLLEGETQGELMRDALDHIARTCHQSRQQSRRIRWIEARANGALEGKPYDANLIELPIEVDREIDRFKRRDGRQLARIRVLEAALQLNHDWHKLYDDHGGYAESTLYQTNTEALSREVPSCTWSCLEFSWSSTCGMAGWEFTDGGTPAENGMRFCHCCGRPLVVAEAEE